MGMSLVLQLFGHKPVLDKLEFWPYAGWRVKKTTKLITIYTEGNMSVCGTFHGNPSSNCWDSLLKITNNLMVEPEEKSGHHQSC